MDNYSDDDFEDLGDNILQELENNALQFTQANKSHFTQNAASQDYGLQDDDLDDTVVIDELAPKVAQPAVPDRPNAQPQPLAPTFSGQPRLGQQGHQQLAPKNRPPPLVSRPSQQLPSRPVPYGRPTQSSQLGHPPSTNLRPGLQASQSNFAGGDVVETLKTRLDALQSELNAARGEAAILRKTAEKAKAKHEAEVAHMRKVNAEALALKERQVDMAVAAERKAVTDLEFTRQDLKEELGRTKPKRRDEVATAATPKKTNKWGMGDGFDDIEILTSPSKGQGQRRREAGAVANSLVERTPTKGKRKRPVVDSPIHALEIHSEDVAMLDDGAAHAEQALPDMGSIKANAYHDFHKLVLAHGVVHGQPLTFDMFARYALPSDPARSFASILIHQLASMRESQNAVDNLVEFCNMILDLWTQCLAEKYYQPIGDLAALIFFTLQLNTTGVAPRIITSLLPTVQETCSLVAQPIHTGNDSGLSYLISIEQCLSIIYLSALGCIGTPMAESTPATESAPEGGADELPDPGDARVQFWKLISLDFLAGLLANRQQEVAFMGAHSLLCTSVFPDSIGPIPPPAPAADESIGSVTSNGTHSVGYSGQKIVNHISQSLTAPVGWATPRSTKMCEARLKVLQVLQVFATSPFGLYAMAGSDVTIPRLVTLLSWAVDRLYDMDVTTFEWNMDALSPRQGAAAPADESGVQSIQPRVKELNTGRTTKAASTTTGLSKPPPVTLNLEPDQKPLLFRIIGQAMLLLHTLVTDPRTSGLVNMAEKLAKYHGGVQRYPLMLARINWVEDDLVLEAGIETDTMDLAHELLELFLTPQDAEAMSAMFNL